MWRQFEWPQRRVTSDNYSRYLCKQFTIKLLLQYSFRKIFIGQNLKHIHVTFSFPELLIFTNFWYFLFGVWFLSLSKKTYTPKWWNKTKKYKFSPVSDDDVEESCSFNVELKVPYFMYHSFKFSWTLCSKTKK